MSDKLADVIDFQAFKNKKLGIKAPDLVKEFEVASLPPTYVVTDTHYVFGTVIKAVPKKEDQK